MNKSKNTINLRANLLAERIELGASELSSFAEELSDAEWMTPVPGDGRSIGVIVHHVASVYPIEVELAGMLASGKPITEATKEVIDDMNAKHALDYSAVGKSATVELLYSNSRAAADAVRAFSDSELDSAATVSLNFNAPLTAQFFIEDHALRHSFHHLARIRATLKK